MVDSANRISTAQTYVRMARTTVEQMTSNGARIQYTPAVVHEHAGSYMVSAYVGGSEYLTQDIQAMSSAYLNNGSYITVARMDNVSWVDSVLPTSMYSKMMIDYDNKRIFIGDGTSPPTDAGQPGQILASGGPGGAVYWLGSGGVGSAEVVTLSTGEYVTDSDGAAVGIGV
jgi:hypothetical protein